MDYTELKKLLPEFPKIWRGNEHSRCLELLKKADKLDSRSYQFSGEEEEIGWVMQSEASNLRYAAQTYCVHEIVTTIDEDYTNDARKKITRIIKCQVCNKIFQNVTRSEPLSDEAMWR